MPFVSFAPAHCEVNPHKRPQRDFGFNPFFQILSAVENELNGNQSKSEQRETPKRRKTVIKPRFDIRATEAAYHIEGELPGVSDKESLDIRFVDEHTLVIKGEITRKTLESNVDNGAGAEEAGKQPERSVSPTLSTRSLNATVEEVDETTGEVAPSATTITKSETAPQISSEEKSKGPKFWLTERSVGVFERRFEFQDLIDQEGVKATLEHGILEIVVPRRQPVVKKVQIL